MNRHEIVELNGWIPFSEKKPPLSKSVLVWNLWGDEVDLRHLVRREATRAGDGRKFQVYSWYPGGSDTDGSYWREIPKTPTLKVT